MTTVYTVGHSNKPLAAFIGLLQNAGITRLVDVRSRPSSRFNPWFNRKSLEAELPAAGIQYHWMGNQLGGLDGNVNYDQGIQEVLTMAEIDRTAVMCSEGPTTKCHRRYMLTPDFQANGAEVMDINWDGSMSEAAPQQQTAVSDTPATDPLF